MTSELVSLRAAAESCVACRLSETRTKVVFGEGADDADLMFVGEAPGRNEDQQGKPFVGAAGRLLSQLLDEVGIERSRTYIANVLKCRPPNNRDPRPDEIDACKGYLRRQIELIDPSVVVTLGNFATKLLLRTDTGITKMRGQAYRWWRGATLIPTYHPAAALRGGDRVTDLMREDFALMRATLDAPPPPPEPSEPEQAPTQAEQLGLFGR